MNHEPSFFDFAAEVGLTKHIGGVSATRLLAERCHIGAGSYVLDVGFGVGVTPCYLAQNYGCRVMGVDIREAMVEKSKERARSQGLSDQVEFRVADAQELPFVDDLFDAVITESVTVFPADKQKAVNEYVRVTRLGGYIGLNESTWLKTPPPPEMVAWASKDLGASVTPLTAEDWNVLLETAGAQEIDSETFSIDLKTETQGLVGRYGCLGALGVVGRMLRLYACSPAYRQFFKDVQQEGITPPGLEEFFGYGVYVGRKVKS